MVVNESGLMANMKSAVKTTGYTVAGTGTKEYPGLMISNGYWAVVLRGEVIPRNVIGLIATHTGKLPGIEEAFHVFKKDVQDEIYEMAVREVRGLQKMAQRMEKEADLHLRTIKPTSLTFGGWNIWQLPHNLEIKKINPERQKVMQLTGMEDVYLMGNTLYVEDGVSAAFLTCETVSDTEEPMVKHLEQFQWITAE